jgi:putative acetyltransferase
MNPDFMNNVSFRPARAWDRERIIALVTNCLAEYGMQPDFESSEADLEDIENTYFQPGGHFEVVEDKRGNLLGTFGLLPLGDRTCKLRKMYLVPEVRGIGLGKHMLERAIAHAKRLGFEVMMLETASTMKKAIRLYTRSGFLPHRLKAASPRCDQVYFLDLKE